MTKQMRYLRADEDGIFQYAIVYSKFEKPSGGMMMIGAFNGYAGGGVYDGGYFSIDLGARLSQVLSYDEADSSEYSEEFSKLMRLCCSFFKGVEYPAECTAKAWKLLEKGEDVDGHRLYMDAEFNGDWLSDVSQEWCISLGF